MHFTTSFGLLAACVFLATEMMLLQVGAGTVFTHFSSSKPITGLRSKRILQKFEIGRSRQKATVILYSADNKLQRRDSNTTAPATASNLTTIDLTPAKCTSTQCYAGAFQRPNQTDCDTVWDAQLYNSTGSLTAAPGTFVYVFAGTCAVVFQHPDKDNYSLQLNWAQLGAVGLDVNTQCLPPAYSGIGGACIFEHYLNYTLTDVLVSVQTHVPETN